MVVLEYGRGKAGPYSHTPILPHSRTPSSPSSSRCCPAAYHGPLSRERLRESQHLFSMASPLHVFADGDASEDCQLFFNIDANDTDDFAIEHQHERVIAFPKLIRMVLLIAIEDATVFKKDLPADCMIAPPLSNR